ncbi:hypothetical protein [Nitratireductor sp. ZSWI3]|uniref:hypothetical protein n=1 Tax=Nitratireductor sp. ZSWI3 TaxID=2966359 RepID=UPI0021501831|nr:hypothetical protein [Nitratireductor sp. ZSWI3]MCR4266629.1 hypothetical protein [Nitratireductor sp. ZSWI3]
MADRSKKIASVTSRFPAAEHNARRTSEVARLYAKKARSDEQTCREHLPTTGKALPAEIGDAILKLARVLARQAAREDHARQQAGSASHDETRGDLREIFHRPAK